MRSVSVSDRLWFARFLGRFLPQLSVLFLFLLMLMLDWYGWCGGSFVVCVIWMAVGDFGGRPQITTFLKCQYALSYFEPLFEPFPKRKKNIVVSKSK